MQDDVSAAQAAEEQPLPPTIVRAFDAVSMRVRHRDATCQHHGEYVEKGIAMSGGSVRWAGCPTCARVAESRLVAATRQREAEAAEDESRMREAEAMRKRIGMANIPRSLAGKTFDGFKLLSVGHRRAVGAVREYAATFDSDALQAGRWLVLCGGTGTGKSHLCGALMSELVARRAVQYATAWDIVAMIRDTWRRDSDTSQMQMLRHLGQDIEFLVIDEVGLWSGSDFERTLLSHVLDHRYRNCMPTALCTNLPPESLESDLGSRVWSRIAERAVIVPMMFTDYRKTPQ